METLQTVGPVPCWTLPIRRTARFAQRTLRPPNCCAGRAGRRLCRATCILGSEDGGYAFEQVVSLGPFTGALQQAIYALKFRNQVRLGRALGERMGQCLAEQLAPLDCLLPVPLHPARQRERGFNQSAEIAAGLGAVLGVPVCHGVVRRQRNTRQQAFLSAEERRANIRGAFAPVAALPASFRIGIVDDVWTTGETVAACAQAVESDRLWAVVLARSGAGDLLT